jgi:hypothetical protein
LAADLARPVARVSMPRLPRLHTPESTVHVVGRCNNREFCFTTPADFRSVPGTGLPNCEGAKRVCNLIRGTCVILP